MNISEMLNPQDSNAPPRKLSRQERREDSRVSAAAAAAVEPDSTKDGGPGGAAAGGQSEADAAGPDKTITVEGVGVTFFGSTVRFIVFRHPIFHTLHTLREATSVNNEPLTNVRVFTANTHSSEFSIGGERPGSTIKDPSGTAMMTMSAKSAQDVTVNSEEIPCKSLVLEVDECNNCRGSEIPSVSCIWKTCGHFRLWFPNLGDAKVSVNMSGHTSMCKDHPNLDMTEYWNKDSHATFHVEYSSAQVQLVITKQILTGRPIAKRKLTSTKWTNYVWTATPPPNPSKS